MDLDWDDPLLAVESDDRRTFKHRLLQSWFRQEVLGARPGSYTPPGKDKRRLGSLLCNDDLLFRPELNFLGFVKRFWPHRGVLVWPHLNVWKSGLYVRL